MGNMGKWVAGVLGGLVALVGLFFAANATDNGAYYGGLVIFLVGIAFIFYQLKRGLDAAESHWQQSRAGKSGGSQSGGSKAAGAKAAASSSGGKSASSTAKSAGSASGGKGGRPGSNGANATKGSGG